MIFLITSSLLGAINFIATIIQLRAKGLTFMRFPFFVWAQLVTAFLLLLAFPPLEAAGVMQLMDRLAAPASSSRAALSSAARSSPTPAEATRFLCSTCSGSWRTRKSMC